MSEEEQEKKGFRVVDKRRFNAEGETRTDVPERPDPPPVQVPPPSARPQQPRAAQPGAPAPQAAAPAAAPSAQHDTRRPDPRAQPPQAAAPAMPEPEDDHTAQGGIDFIQFVASLATNALASLGALPEARAQGVPMSLEMAREYIEIIGMLQAKTRGNLSREEEMSLQRIVSELRMVYVEVTQRIAKGPQQPGR